MAEFHIHGGRAVIRALEMALETLGARRAQAGEFSRRAFHNNKIDLTGAEALADLIDAESEAQRIQALAQADGVLERLYSGWAGHVAHALAHVEASLDFSDEELPTDLIDGARADIAALIEEIDDHLNDGRRGERLRQGFRIAVLGAPNAGKSSLINYLSDRDVAIVSHIAGTTRDVIEVHLDLGGYPAILFDTAGLRETEDEIESEGIARARKAADKADLNLLIFDASLPMDADTLALHDSKSIVVLNKADLPAYNWPAYNWKTSEAYLVSAHTGQGMVALVDAMVGRIAVLCGDLTHPTPTRERHRSHLVQARESLFGFIGQNQPDLAAEELRLALRSLGRITGRVDVEDLLDLIFRDFCIGK